MNSGLLTLDLRPSECERNRDVLTSGSGAERAEAVVGVALNLLPDNLVMAPV